MKPNWYFIITRAIEEGVSIGYNRAHKHIDNPNEDLIKAAINEAVMNSLCEIINFEINHEQ